MQTKLLTHILLAGSLCIPCIGPLAYHCLTTLGV